MSDKFTVGPWKAIEHSWSRTGIYAENEAIAILDIYYEATEENQGELQDRMEANARLISAAPDLLAALKAVLDAYAIPSSVCKERPVYEQAVAAIKKATGVQP